MEATRLTCGLRFYNDSELELWYQTDRLKHGAQNKSAWAWDRLVALRTFYGQSVFFPSGASVPGFVRELSVKTSITTQPTLAPSWISQSSHHHILFTDRQKQLFFWMDGIYAIYICMATTFVRYTSPILTPQMGFDRMNRRRSLQGWPKHQSFQFEINDSFRLHQIRLQFVEQTNQKSQVHQW